MTEKQPQRDLMERPPTHPIHVIQDDEARLQEINDLAYEIFGLQLTFDWLSNSLSFRVGSIGSDPPRVNAIPGEYRRELAALPQLSTQGDGVNSAMGLLIAMVGGFQPVMLIDEPEAFLHPPQARTLGRAIARIARERGRQVLLATHDKNLLQGLVEDDSDVAILRTPDMVGPPNQETAGQPRTHRTNAFAKRSMIDGASRWIVGIVALDAHNNRRRRCRSVAGAQRHTAACWLRCPCAAWRPAGARSSIPVLCPES